MAITMEGEIKTVHVLLKIYEYGIDLIGVFRTRADAEIGIVYKIKDVDLPYMIGQRESSRDNWNKNLERYKLDYPVVYKNYRPVIIDKTDEQLIEEIEKQYQIREVVLGKILDGETLYSE